MELRLGIHQGDPPILDVSSQSPCDWLLLVVNKQHNNTLLSQGHLLLFESPGVRGHHLRMLQISQMSIACNLHPCPTIHTISNIWIKFLSFSGLLELHRSSIQSSTNITNKSQTRLNTFSFLLLIRLVNAYLENRARVAGEAGRLKHGPPKWCSEGRWQCGGYYRKKRVIESMKHDNVWQCNRL